MQDYLFPYLFCKTEKTNAPASYSCLVGALLRLSTPDLIIIGNLGRYLYFIASSIATATETDAPTIGLLPIPMSPIISTWAGTDEEPAN